MSKMLYAKTLIRDLERRVSRLDEMIEDANNGSWKLTPKIKHETLTAIHAKRRAFKEAIASAKFIYTRSTRDNSKQRRK